MEIQTVQQREARLTLKSQ